MIPDWASEKQDWLVKVQHANYAVNVFAVSSLTFAELQLHCQANWPREYEANRVIASSLTNEWSAE